MHKEQTDEWKEAAVASYRAYLDKLDAELGESAGIAAIEEAMHSHYQKMMSETMQIIADNQQFSPRD